MNGIHFQCYCREGYKQVRHCIGDWLHALLREPVQVEAALNEAVNNAFRQGDRVDITIRVMNGKRLIMRVKDGGCGFAGNSRVVGLAREFPTEQELWQESGRGLRIMCAVLDRVTYNRQGNEVLLVKSMATNRHPRRMPDLPDMASYLAVQSVAGRQKGLGE
ncbi:MAG: ATP-binding protein [Paenibacillaceae bacterium]|nr:ATP-binding protein [Paenibacillaceae bacterium]